MDPAPADPAVELEHRRLDHLQHQASALSSACDELLSETSHRSNDIRAISQARVARTRARVYVAGGASVPWTVSRVAAWSHAAAKA